MLKNTCIKKIKVTYIITYIHTYDEKVFICIAMEMSENEKQEIFPFSFYSLKNVISVYTFIKKNTIG